MSAKCLPSVGPRLGLCVLLGALSCFGQTQAEITGLITDSSAAVVAGATATVTSQGTNAVRISTTNASGIYSFPALLPGAYDLKIEKTGFRAVEQKSILLQVQQVARIDMVLQVGQVSDTIEVSANAALLNTEDATVGTVIENKRILELPLNGRNYLQLVAISPNVNVGFGNAGAIGGRMGGTRSEQQISIAGQRKDFNYFTLDGITNTDVNFNTYSILPSIDALQEFKVQTGVYPAEFGREASQINVSTKAGTNDYHGALFEFLRNSVLDAKPYAFTAARPAAAPFKWNQYGFTLGGPISIPKHFDGRNKFFFMSNFEGYRDRKQFQNTYSVPSAAMRTGDFSQILPGTVIKDPLSGSPFAGNLIPSSRFSPIAVKLLEFYPLPNIAGNSLANNYLALDNRQINKDQFNQRIDYIENSSSSWFGRYSWSDELQVLPALMLNGTSVASQAKQAMISNTRILRPNLVNEARFGYIGFFNSLGTELANKRNVEGELGIPGLTNTAPAVWGSPNISLLGFSGFGDVGDGPYVNHNHTFQWTDSITWIHGKHSFKFGGDIRRDRYNSSGNSFIRGVLTIENQATGYGFSDYMIGNLRRTEVARGVAILQFRATSQAYYADDTWKITPTLTLTMGLRYEFTPPWANKGDNLINAFVPFIDTVPNVTDLSRHPVLVRAGGGDPYENTLLRFNPAIQFVRDGRLGDRLMQSDYNDFAPRLGMAWSPSNRWSIRAGAGVFYVQDQSNGVFDMGRNIAGRVRDDANPDTPNLTFEHPYNVGAGAVNPCGVSAPQFCISTPLVLSFVHHRRTPYEFQYLLNVQRELDKSTTLEVGYLGSASHKLFREGVVNQPIPGATGALTSREPYPEFGLVTLPENIVNANYNAFTAKLTRRLSNGLSVLAGYTWSKALDGGSGIRTIGTDPLFAQTSYCYKCEYARSVSDTPHRFVATVLYEVPFGKGKQMFNHGLGDAVLGGWEISSLVTVQSGFPLTALVGKDQSNTGVGFDRPNANGRPSAPSNPTTGQWFNTAAYTLQPLGSFGNAGRNTITGPGVLQWDFSTLKAFRFAETRYLQFRFESFNAPNHPNWADPTTTLINPNFGKITSTRAAMRELQFALKLIF